MTREAKLNITEIVSQLEAERTRINNAISALEGIPLDGVDKGMKVRRSGSEPKVRHLSAAVESEFRI